MIRLITRDSLFYKRQEVWFYQGEAIHLYDNNLYYQAKSLPNTKSIQHKTNFYTSCIDLTLNEDLLFHNIDSNFKNEIRRAGKAGGVFESIERPLDENLSSHMLLYSQFCVLKNLLPPDKCRTFALFGSNNFMITKLKYAEKEIVVHTYIMDDDRARLLTSYHDIKFSDNKLRGYFNKYLHWKDIQFFKSKGLRIYDFGGVDVEGYPGVASFKKSFGGYDEQSFNFVVRKGIYRQIKYIF